MVQSASIVDQALAHRREHINVYFCQIQIQKLHASFICFVKINAFTFRDRVSLDTFLFLAFFLFQMVSRSDLGNIIHPLGTQLQFHIASGTVVVKCNMKGLISIVAFVAYIIAIIRLYIVI